jgi:hypothetical protein
MPGESAFEPRRPRRASIGLEEAAGNYVIEQPRSKRFIGYPGRKLTESAKAFSFFSSRYALSHAGRSRCALQRLSRDSCRQRRMNRFDHEEILINGLPGLKNRQKPSAGFPASLIHFSSKSFHTTRTLRGT